MHSFFSGEKRNDVFALVLSVLCVQSHDGVRASVKVCFQTLSHEGSMRAVGYRQHQRVFPVFVSCNKDLKDFLPLAA
jgi:hypothetical protein